MEFTLTKNKHSARGNSERLNLVFQAIGSLFSYEHMGERGKTLSLTAMKWTQEQKLWTHWVYLHCWMKEGQGEGWSLKLILQCFVTLYLWLCARLLHLDFFQYLSAGRSLALGRKPAPWHSLLFTSRADVISVSCCFKWKKSLLKDLCICSTDFYQSSDKHLTSKKN